MTHMAKKGPPAKSTAKPTKKSRSKGGAKMSVPPPSKAAPALPLFRSIHAFSFAVPLMNENDLSDFFDPRFDEALRRVGLFRAVNVDKYAKHLAPIAKEFEESSKYGEYLHFVAPPPQYEFCVLAAPFLNAVVFKHEGKYVVGITLELALRCQIFVNHLFANRRFYPKLGNAALEKEFLPMPRFEPMNFKVARAAAQVRPSCPIRRDAAWLFGSLMLSFILCHEKAHVLRGHVDFMGTQGIRGITEGVFDIGMLAGLSQEVRVAQEFDADRDGVLTVLRVAYVEMKKWADYSTLNLEQEHTKLVALAAYCAIGLLEPWDGSNWLRAFEDGYPPQAIRRMNVVYSAVIGRYAGVGARVWDPEATRTFEEILAEGETIFWLPDSCKGQALPRRQMARPQVKKRFMKSISSALNSGKNTLNRIVYMHTLT